MLARQAEQVAMYLFSNGIKDGKHICVGSVRGESGQSLKIIVEGDKAGFWRDFAADESGDLVDLWALSKDIEKAEAIKEIRDYLGLVKPVSQALKLVRPVAQSAVAEKGISREYHKTLKSTLAKNQGAMAYLLGEKRGLTPLTIDHFGLGLSGEYEKSDGSITAAAVVAPMRSRRGDFLNKSAYICVPDVTLNPIDKNGWMKGEPQTYYSDAISRQRVLFVCEGLKDVWRHWQALSEAKLTEEILLISSTHGSAIPSEWKNNDFWKNWDRVYLGHDNDDAGKKIAEKLLEFIGREAHRIEVPKDIGKDWTDFWQNEGSIEKFKYLMDNAPTASGVTVETVNNRDNTIPRIGRFSHRPVDINSAYVGGHLYYPTETHVIKRDEDTGFMVERLETIVIRSDRTIHRAMYAPSPAGTPLHKRVLKLTDGTVIEKEPKASALHSWDFESINVYLNRKNQNRQLNDIINDVLCVLKQSIWLPYPEDYVVLALTVPVTFLQTVFESVPLILMNGPAGSGKSQTGNTMAKLCCNGVVIGQVSAASAARLIDETRGFVVLDDVESIAAKAGKDIQANEFVQALKVSYNKHTGVKYWTDIKTMKTEKLDFYGVKLLSNTLGADSILGTSTERRKFTG